MAPKIENEVCALFCALCSGPDLEYCWDAAVARTPCLVVGAGNKVEVLSSDVYTPALDSVSCVKQYQWP